MYKTVCVLKVSVALRTLAKVSHSPVLVFVIYDALQTWVSANDKKLANVYWDVLSFLCYQDTT